MYHLSPLGVGRESCPTGAEITWSLGGLDPFGGLYPLLESSHTLVSHSHTPGALTPACLQSPKSGRDYPSAFLSARLPRAPLDWGLKGTD